MNHRGCRQTVDEVSGTPTMLEKHQRAKCTGTPSMCTGTPEQKKWQWAKCTGTPSMCTGTPEQKIGSIKSVPVHH